MKPWLSDSKTKINQPLNSFLAEEALRGPGWPSHLLDPFSSFPRVGSKDKSRFPDLSRIFHGPFHKTFVNMELMQ